MTTFTIPRELIKEKELVILPRKKYEEFINLEKIWKVRSREEGDTDSAIQTYKKEKDRGRLKILRSLADLD